MHPRTGGKKSIRIFRAEKQSRVGCVCVLVTQSCPTLCDPMDCSPPGSSVHGILQARRRGLPCPPPWNLPNPGIEPRSPALQTESLPSEPQGKPEGSYKMVIDQSHWVGGAGGPQFEGGDAPVWG